MKKVAYVFDGDYLTVRMFQRMDWGLHGIDTDATPDLVVFTGGEDVSPSYYNEENVASGCNPIRDAEEAEIFEKFKDVPKVGICRGGQFLNVMSGGRMWQDTDRHDRYHKLRDILSGQEYFVSSTHHQMMRPSGLAEIVATADESTYRMAATANDTKALEFYHDIEVLFYKNTNSLCFQPHPEYDGKHETERYFFDLLNRYFRFDEVYDVGQTRAEQELYDNFEGAF